MTTKQITYWTTLLVLALVVVVDVYMAVHGRQLISGVMLESARKHPHHRRAGWDFNRSFILAARLSMRYIVLSLLLVAGCGVNPKVTPYVDGDAGRSLYLGVQVEWKI
jgi:hypothetical protein